jgi:hypothetical protein
MSVTTQSLPLRLAGLHRTADRDLSERSFLVVSKAVHLTMCAAAVEEHR